MVTTEQQVKDEEISLKDVILKFISVMKYLRSKWKVILITGILGGLVGLAYSYFKRPIYKAELSFALEDEKSMSGGIGAAAGLASQFGFDLGSGSGGGIFSGDNLLELMRSRLMVESTLLTPVNINGNKLTLVELYIRFNNYREKWENKPGLKNISFSPNAVRSVFTLQQDSILGVFYRDIIKNNLSVNKVDKKLSIITVRVDSKNELFSKYFTEILVKNVSDFFIETKTKKSVQNVRILQHQADSVRRELNADITGAALSIDAAPNANPNLQVLRAPSQHRQVDAQANQAILTELVKNLEISKVALRKETPLIQMIDTPILPLEKSSIGKAEGIAIGALLGGIIAVLFLSLKYVFSRLLK